MDLRFGVGGWLNAEDAENFLAYGEVYKMTVDVLIDHFEKNPEKLLEEAERSGNIEPAILPSHALGILSLAYNFRHYIELKLKGLILKKNGKIKNTHDINQLLKKLKEIAPSARISKDTEDIIEKIQKIDNRSADAFRYPYDSEQNRHFTENSEFLEMINDFGKFKGIVTTVMEDLTNIEGDFDYEQENLDAQREYYSESMN